MQGNSRGRPLCRLDGRETNKAQEGVSAQLRFLVPSCASEKKKTILYVGAYVGDGRVAIDLCATGPRIPKKRERAHVTASESATKEPV